MPQTPSRSLRSLMVAGSAWMIAMRWSVRGIGIVSTIILARLLAPADFGLLAMSLIFIALLDVLTSFGVDMVLIQRTDATKEHYDTAWTIRLLQTLGVAGVVLIIAPHTAAYFHEPRVTSLMQFLSIGIAMSGFANIGIVNFRKELAFGKEFTYMVATKFGSFIATITLAIVLRNYWALAFGILFQRMLAVTLSYTMHPYRPSFSLKKFHELWSFSQWLLLRNVGMYIRKQLDSFLVARIFPTGQVGLYGVAKEVSELASNEVIWPVARALFPGYALIAREPRRLGRVYLKVLATMLMVALPIGVGLALVAHPFVVVAFGERWAPAAPVLTWMAINGIAFVVSTSVQNPIIALGRMRRAVVLVWSQLLVAIPILLYAARQESLVAIAQAQAASSLILMPLFFYSVTSLDIVTWRDLGHAIWRPLISTLAMAACVLAVPGSWYTAPLDELIVKATIGAGVFVGIDLALWVAAKRPDGGEQMAIDLISAKFPALRGFAGPG